MQIKNRGYLIFVSILTMILALVMVKVLDFDLLWGVLIISLLFIGELCLYVPQKIFRSNGDDIWVIVFHLIFLVLSWLVFLLVGSKLMYEQQNPSGIFYVPALAVVVVAGRVKILGIFTEAK